MSNDTELSKELSRLTRLMMLHDLVPNVFNNDALMRAILSGWERTPTLSQVVRKMAEEEKCQQERESTDATGS